MPRQVVVLVLDGLGWEQFVQSTREHAPTLAAFDGRPDHDRRAVDDGDRAHVDHHRADARRARSGRLPHRRRRRHPQRAALGDGDAATRGASTNRVACSRSLRSWAQPVPVISKADLERTGFTEAHLRGGRLVGWRAASSLAVTVGQLLREGEPFVYAYYDGIDKIAHERGFGRTTTPSCASVDDIVAQVRAQLTDGAALLVTADHGQVDVGDQHA